LYVGREIEDEVEMLGKGSIHVLEDETRIFVEESCAPRFVSGRRSQINFVRLR
jgi:hypothetical protein